MKKLVEKFKQKLIGLSCITFVSQEEYEAIQRANTMNSVIKLLILAIAIAIIGFIFFKYRNHRKKVIIAAIIIIVLLSGGYIAYKSYNPIMYSEEPILMDTLKQTETIESTTDAKIPIKCGGSTLKKWWEF